MGIGYKTSWPAVPGGDSTQVADALGLLMRVTMDWEAATEAAYRRGVFVASPVDGWTPAHGRIHLPAGLEDTVHPSCPGFGHSASAWATFSTSGPIASASTTPGREWTPAESSGPTATTAQPGTCPCDSVSQPRSSANSVSESGGRNRGWHTQPGTNPTGVTGTPPCHPRGTSWPSPGTGAFALSTSRKRHRRATASMAFHLEPSDFRRRRDKGPVEDELRAWEAACSTGRFTENCSVRLGSWVSDRKGLLGAC